MKNIQKLTAILTIAATLVFGSIPAFAATSTTAGNGINGYKVSPVRTDLTISPGQSQAVTVYVQNVSSAVEYVTTIFNDFQAKDENGSPGLLLNGANAPKHGLKQFVTIPNPNFTLQPNEQKSVTVQINVPKNAPGGGYYGAVRFAPQGSVGDKNVNLAASVSSLILIKVPGNVTEQMTIASFTIQKKPSDSSVTPSSSSFYTSGKNLQAMVRFQNEGDVQEAPFGKILVKKGSKIIDQEEINTNSTEPSNVLPNSIRRFTVDLHNIGSYGKYTVEGNFGYGSSGQLVSAKTTFYVIPYALMVIGIIILIIIIALVVTLPRWLRRHDEGVLRRAKNSRR